MAHQVSKHDPSLPPPVIGPKPSMVGFAMLFVVVSLPTILLSIFAQGHPVRRYISLIDPSDGEIAAKQMVAFFGVPFIVILAIALALPLAKAKPYAYRIAGICLLVSPLYVYCCASNTTVPTWTFFCVGTVNIALGLVAFVLKSRCI
jgi:hypothetical protein